MGIIIDVRPVQPSNALLPILVTELGIVYDALGFPIGYCIKLYLFLSNNTPAEELKVGFVASTDIDVRAVHKINASEPINVTELGIMIVTNLVQLKNAVSPILVTPLYKTAFISVVLFWNVVGITAINPL